ncbi:MAG: 50S ribosomal protein L22 [Thermoleophilaceae bacterium]|nr:50S ribosomal protein L22 [Thermoleophilaceae bacterium]
MTPPAGEAPEGGWESLKVAELQEELEARGLPKSGKKAELVARLEEDDAKGGEAEAPEAKAPEETPEAEEKPARRRGSAETGTPRKRARKPAPEGEIIVLARARYVRSAPRKARLVMNHIRGKPVEQAQAILRHAPRAVSVDILKLLNSAVANAESGHELGADELRIHRCYVDEGPTIKRYRPRALGRATRILKRTSHMTIELTTAERNGR